MTKEVHAAHILCKTEKKALEVKELLASGQESFAQMARKYSQYPSGKSGGDLGWFPQGYLTQPDVETAAFALQPGQYSDVIKSDLGYHIIYVIERDANHPLSVDARRALQEAKLKQWLADQKASATIVITLP